MGSQGRGLKPGTTMARVLGVKGSEFEMGSYANLCVFIFRILTFNLKGQLGPDGLRVLLDLPGNCGRQPGMDREKKSGFGVRMPTLTLLSMALGPGFGPSGPLSPHQKRGLD